MTKLIKKNPGGRPTKYNVGMLQSTLEYLENCKADERSLPSVEGLALSLGINKDTVYEWDKRYPKFSDALKEIKMAQKQRLQENGLTNRFNPTMAIFLLKTNHGMIEKTQVDTNVSLDHQIRMVYTPEKLPAGFVEGEVDEE